MLDLPTGTVSFLFTDIQESARLVGEYPRAYLAAFVRHNLILGAVVRAHGGSVFQTTGDHLNIAFSRASDAVAAALDGQLALNAEDWGDLGELRVRMGLHSGDAELLAGHYLDEPLFRCALLTGLAHGGQVLLSAATTELVRDKLPERASLRHLGRYRLRVLASPERVAQLLHPSLQAEYPPLRSTRCGTSPKRSTGNDCADRSGSATDGWVSRGWNPSCYQRVSPLGPRNWGP